MQEAQACYTHASLIPYVAAPASKGQDKFFSLEGRCFQCPVGMEVPIGVWGHVSWYIHRCTARKCDSLQVTQNGTQQQSVQDQEAARVSSGLLNASAQDYRPALNKEAAERMQVGYHISRAWIWVHTL